MLSFESDYIEGAHPLILKKLEETNLEQWSGYGEDPLSISAKNKIRLACGCPDADVFFIAGGTETNQIVVSSMLAGYEGVIAADTGHVNVHEAGAIEATGHKVLALPGDNGVLRAGEVKRFLAAFYADENRDHTVFPGMVYISFPTELGTLYSKAELKALRAVCTEYGIPLYVDGARLACGLMSPECDLTLEELAALADVFYIGGTKMGALIGEALVFPRGNAPAHFITTVKQRGALLAKGRLLGAQFDVLFTDGLYLALGRRAIDSAMKLKALFISKGFTLFMDSPTNQQFVIMSDEKLASIRGRVGFSFWQRYDASHSVVRFATSWATTDDKLAALAELI